MKNYLIIFPNDKLIDEICSLSYISSTFYIVPQEINVNIYNNKNIIIVSSENCQKIKEMALKVFCCNEEAIYWLRLNVSNLWQLQFCSSYLSLLEKDNFKKHIIRYGVNASLFVYTPKEITNLYLQ